jgi:hypothetical protein
MQEMRVRGGRARSVETRERRCGTCGNGEHNACTCKVDVDTSTESDSE